MMPALVAPRRWILRTVLGLGLSGLGGPVGLIVVTGHGGELLRCARPVRAQGTRALVPALRCATALAARSGGSLVGAQMGSALTRAAKAPKP